MDKGHLERILREFDTTDLVVGLASLPAPDFQTLLMEVHRRRSESATPKQLVQQYANDRFVRPSATDPRVQNEFDQLAYSLAASFEPIELSPLAPFGVVSALTNLRQDNAITSSRNSEVVSDCTNVLALESAMRRRKDSAKAVRRCTSHRLTRTKKHDDPASFAHFRLFALTTAGRAEADYGFEIDALTEHLSFYLTLLGELTLRGYRLGQLRVLLTELEGAPGGRLIKPLIDRMAPVWPNVSFERDADCDSGRGYYESLRFKVFAHAEGGEEHFIADGGFTDWTQQLLNNRKERLLISALGSERVLALFAP
jgi:hypothetical protein